MGSNLRGHVVQEVFVTQLLPQGLIGITIIVQLHQSSRLDAYDAAQTAGRDAALGRKHMPLPVAKPPFYAIRMQGTQILTFAGLGIDKDLRVIREEGDPIANLYAAGEVIGAGATTGNALVNGMALTPALTFGRMIGQNLPIAS